MIDIETLTLRQLRELGTTLGALGLLPVAAAGPPAYPFKPGDIVCVETILPHLVGILESVTADVIVLRDAAWVPSTGRYSAFAAGAEPDEVEPLPPGQFAIERTSVIGVRLHSHQLRVLK